VNYTFLFKLIFWVLFVADEGYYFSDITHGKLVTTIHHQLEILAYPAATVAHLPLKRSQSHVDCHGALLQQSNRYLHLLHPTLPILGLSWVQPARWFRVRYVERLSVLFRRLLHLFYLSVHATLNGLLPDHFSLYCRRQQLVHDP
jgi:hypothetical protein